MSTGSMTDVIKDTSDFLPYFNKMIPHLTLLGVVLGVGDFATATLGGPGSLQEKCLQILSHWLRVNPNPTWKLFCDQLGKATNFIGLRARIAQDHDVSGDGPRPRESYRHVKAKDVLRVFNWRELVQDIKDMLTVLRLQIMQREYNLIDSACNSSIKACLDRGDPYEAATMLIEYFEKNPDGDALLRFCKFLRDEAEESGGAARLKDLADKIERAVKAEGPPGEVLLGSLDVDPKETSSSRYSGTGTSPPYVSKEVLIIIVMSKVKEILPGKGREEKTAQQDSVSHGVQMNHEEDLLRLCWIPFGLQTLIVDRESDDRTFLLQPNTGGCGKDDLIRLDVPKGAINTAVCEELSIRYGILVHGPFVLEDDYELVSMVVYIYFNPDHTTKPLILHLPHWASKEETTTVVFAPHEAKGGYNFTKLNENLLLPSTAKFSVPIYGHSTLFARAIKIKARRAFFAIPVESQKETVTTLSVYFTFASQVWHDIIDEYLIDDDHQSQSPLPCDLDENEIIPRLEEDKGAGWEAQCTRTFKIISKHILYESNGIRNKKQLENAVCVSKSYPPYVQCEVKCTREAKMGGQTRRVPLAFRRRGESDGGLKITCTTYSQETIGGSKPDMGDNQPDGAVQVKKPTSAIPGSKPDMGDNQPDGAIQVKKPTSTVPDVLKEKIRKHKGYQKILTNKVAIHTHHLKALSINLGVESGRFIAKNPTDMENALVELLIHWADGNTGKTPIWSDLLKAMKESKMAKEADELEEYLRGGNS